VLLKIILRLQIIKGDKLTKPLSDPEYFRKVKVYENGRGIYWPNEYDFCPDYLRYYAESVKEREIVNNYVD
jgi:hypothetical protein